MTVKRLVKVKAEERVMEKEADDNRNTVFVVEDSDVYRSILVHTLETAGEEYSFRVVDFPSGEKCLQYLHLKPDIIILDHFLNGNGYLYNMDGLSILNRIRRFSPGTDVVIVSCQEDIDVAKQFMGAGVRDYIKKEGASPYKVKTSVLHLLHERAQRKVRSRWMRYAAAAAITTAVTGMIYWLI